MTKQSCMISTDTATICLFDLVAMQHRKDDIGDWWSFPRERELEIANSTVLFIDVGDDGDYEVEVHQIWGEEEVGFCLASPSERLFVGPGEEMSGAGFEPTGEWGGMFVSVDGPYQRVAITRRQNVITIALRPTEPFQNERVDCVPLRNS